MYENRIITSLATEDSYNCEPGKRRVTPIQRIFNFPLDIQEDKMFYIFSLQISHSQSTQRVWLFSLEMISH